MNNSEIKARQFIDKQRKRTATLGAQRHQRGIYKVTSDNPGKLENEEVPVMTSPPIIDFNGETLYDSGMTIKQASISNQNVAKYIQNRRTTNPPRTTGLTIVNAGLMGAKHSAAPSHIGNATG